MSSRWGLFPGDPVLPGVEPQNVPRLLGVK